MLKRRSSTSTSSAPKATAPTLPPPPAPPRKPRRRGRLAAAATSDWPSTRTSATSRALTLGLRSFSGQHPPPNLRKSTPSPSLSIALTSILSRRPPLWLHPSRPPLANRPRRKTSCPPPLLQLRSAANRRACRVSPRLFPASRRVFPASRRARHCRANRRLGASATTPPRALWRRRWLLNMEK
jgi:hypothetical protein